MYQDSNMLASIRKVEAAREENAKLDPRRMTAEEKDTLLKKFHPDYRAEQFTELRFGPNQGQKVPLELAELSAPAAAVKTRHDTVSSLRFDSVLASAFSLARGKAAALIESGRAELDHALCQKPDKPVSEGSILSVRGLGRARLDSVDGTTKKGRIGITVSRFI